MRKKAPRSGIGAVRGVGSGDGLCDVVVGVVVSGARAARNGEDGEVEKKTMASWD